MIGEIGYNNAEFGFDSHTCGGDDHDRRPVARHLDGGDTGGAGDQGLMFGFACNETPELMPMPITLAHKHHPPARPGPSQRQAAGYLRPDGKSQVTVEYDGTRPVRIDTVVVSSQHAESVSQKRIRKDVIEHVIMPLLPKRLVSRAKPVKFHVNPTGLFIKGGPMADTGLTGRKIIVDTYGGMGSHGGGAFSGKDPSKVDRSASYAARWVAKNLVASKLCDRCEIQFAYAIGIREPVSIMVDSFGTGRVSDDKLTHLVRKHFDLTPAGIIKALKLRRPIYRATATYGHFGRSGPGFTWEKTDRARALARSV